MELTANIDPVWKTISSALGAEAREYPTVRGASGIEHHFTALAVDDPGRRLILFSPDPDPRVAALTQVDIQVTMPETRVLIARPLVVDLGVLARKLADTLGSTKIDFARFMAYAQRLQEVPEPVRKRFTNRAMARFNAEAMNPMIEAFHQVSAPMLGQMVGILQQSAHLDWPQIMSMMGRDQSEQFVSLEGLLKMDTLVNDRRHGVCPIPFYELTEEEWGIFRSDVSETRHRLKQLGVYEYFFPAPDELALGFVDGGLGDREKVRKAVAFTERAGHLEGEPSVVGLRDPIVAIEAFREVGYVVEGEFGLEVTAEGEAFRSTVKFRPKESLISKILSRISVNASVTPKDFL